MTDLATVAEPGTGYILVAAHKHPDRDEWVDQQAQAEADNGGLVLGAYLGREDVFGSHRLPELCCHVFTATRRSPPYEPHERSRRDRDER